MDVETELPPAFARALLIWYGRERRDLPWRWTRAPYRIWVSEIMLQQTRVETVIPYYRRFLRRFPSVRSLARARRQDVLKAWEGLGYYRRAANLHEGAKAVVERHGGRFPRDAKAIRALPGIGDYTAGAIRSIALGHNAPLVDGNVARVLARLLAIRRPVRDRAVRARLWEVASAILPAGRAGDFNQAMMELGATVCTPRAPACPSCPVRRWCRAERLGTADRVPTRAQARERPVRREPIALVPRRGRILLRKRPDEGLLGGMWEFPPEAYLRGQGSRLGAGEAVGTYRHGFTHFSQVARVRRYPDARVGPDRALRWVDPRTLGNLPVTRLTTKISAALRGGT
ncbi:MAG: A/G-specific adenine glycosylase [Planctomycetes bacterium]|nr:A/G-specific adenine glycosylase [Planctomycetota bacterium]